GRQTPFSQRERELASANPRMRAASRCLRPRALRYLRSWFNVRVFLTFAISRLLMALSYSKYERSGKTGKVDAGGNSGAVVSDGGGACYRMPGMARTGETLTVDCP